MKRIRNKITLSTEPLLPTHSRNSSLGGGNEAVEITGLRDRGPAAVPGSSGMDAVVESENTRLQEELRSKIHDLKHMSIDIGAELRGQCGMLRDMDSGWDSVSGILGKAMNRVKTLGSGSHNHALLYLILFSLFIFVMMWILLF